MPLSFKHLSKSSQTVLQTIGLFLLITVLIGFFIFFTPAVGITQRVQANFYQISQTVGRWAENVFFARETLRTEHDFYQSLAGQYMHETALVDDLQQRVSELEASLAYEQTIDFKTTLARVLSRSLNENREILIDKGIRDGIIVGQAVVVGNGHLIGIVSDLSDYTATIRLLQDENSSVASAILGSDKTIGLVEGREGYLLSMQFIPQDQRIAIGDIVVTSGLNEQIPSGLIIGAVEQLITDDAAAFQEARLLQIYQENDFSYVTVIQIPL